MTSPPRRALVVPDSFKGTFSAPAVAHAVGRGLERAGLVVDPCPVADGGEGTMEALVAAIGGELVPTVAHDPLGRPIEAAFALLEGGRTAVVETAVASGLSLLAPDERDPWLASTLGTGELIRAALATGAETVLIAVGGSATVDGGSGALEALGAHVGPGRLVVLCDVETTWERCAAVYGPQKGADAALVERLGARLEALAGTFPRDPRGVPRTGAAGGLSGALWAVLGARLDRGAERVLDAVAFQARLAAADVVIAGEGCLDEQTAEGKLLSVVAAQSHDAGVPVHALVGTRRLDDAGRRALGLRSITEASTLAALEIAAEGVGRRVLAEPRQAAEPAIRSV